VVDQEFLGVDEKEALGLGFGEAEETNTIGA
jgi:hypothetical protein